MATKQDIQARGYNAYGTKETNPYKEGSWQYRAWNEGHEASLQSTAQARYDKEANLPRDTGIGVSIPFPDRMPRATRAHILKLEETFHPSANPSGNRLVRIAKKIEKLYARWM